ncbi:hypothetical protein GYMLUDRAFT_247512 [Collybiopsis luxurians FD-317 M1]|uniref:Uncharacterized protein n=1 Tax=Collybiopsis luxurians FD-317 M1 TaxID=944289 RepID=A0A0D0B0X4_9AGAR|nr:hypothetical protein GYMLUDRAFT_247512 [Collybiopsis luxurians FD-317 M1]
MNTNNDATLENSAPVKTGGYQQEKLDESLRRNTTSLRGHTLEARNSHGFWLPPSLCNVIKDALPVSVGLISGALAQEQWKDASLERICSRQIFRNSFGDSAEMKHVTM